MAGTPSPRDWSRIYVAQREDAGKNFGDAAGGNGPDGKPVPLMDAAQARELLKYWVAAGAEVEARAKSDGKTKDSLDRLAAAHKRFTAAMQPFAASVLIDAGKDLRSLQPATGTSIMLGRDACIKFWAAVWQLANALTAVGVSPNASDLWWKSLGEAARDVGNAAKGAAVAVADAAKSGLEGGVMVLVVLGGLWLLSQAKGNRG